MLYELVYPARQKRRLYLGTSRISLFYLEFRDDFLFFNAWCYSSRRKRGGFGLSDSLFRSYICLDRFGNRLFLLSFRSGLWHRKGLKKELFRAPHAIIIHYFHHVYNDR